jgi:uncharacterized repeat protein (TIGR03803 family)
MRQKKPSAIAEMTVAAIAVALLLAPCAMAANTYKVVHRFNGQDGAAPYSALILDASGNFYGTTSSGGTLGGGTVFKLTPIANGSWTESVLYNLPGGPGGSFPYAGLTQDSVGNLYGAAALGGNTSCNNIGGCGTIFKLTSNWDGSWTPSVLHTFTGGDGDGPYGNLVFDTAGQNLYGTTVAGGSGAECPGGCGVVFKLALNSDGSWTESVLHSFTGGADGQLPRAGLVFGAGNLYGTTVLGGGSAVCTGGCGVVFKLAPNSGGSWTESVLHSFSWVDGATPYDALVFDAAGNLYGTTGGGGTGGSGTVFKLAPKPDGSWREIVLHNFGSVQNVEPVGGLIFDSVGNLYGTTWVGGVGDGTVFKMIRNSRGGWTFTKLHLFEGNPAMQPYDSLVSDTAGRLYGTTSACGSAAGCSGTVFEIIP